MPTSVFLSPCAPLLRTSTYFSYRSKAQYIFLCTHVQDIKSLFLSAPLTFAYPRSSFLNLLNINTSSLPFSQPFQLQKDFNFQTDPRHTVRVALPTEWAKIYIAIFYVYKDLFAGPVDSLNDPLPIYNAPIFTKRYLLCGQLVQLWAIYSVCAVSFNFNDTVSFSAKANLRCVKGLRAISYTTSGTFLRHLNTQHLPSPRQSWKSKWL